MKRIKLDSRIKLLPILEIGKVNSTEESTPLSGHINKAVEENFIREE
jgi:hypothetical protein